MRPEEIMREINRLKLSEKLLLVEDIWDALAKDNTDLPLAEWQKNVLSERYGEFKEGRLNLHDWESVHQNLRAKKQP